MAVMISGVIITLQLPYIIHIFWVYFDAEPLWNIGSTALLVLLKLLTTFVAPFTVIKSDGTVHEGIVRMILETAGLHEIAREVNTSQIPLKAMVKQPSQILLRDILDRKWSSLKRVKVSPDVDD